MKSNATTTFAALILIGAGGFFAGRISSASAPDDSRESPVPVRPTRSTSSAPSSASGEGNRPSAAAHAAGNRAVSSDDRLSRLTSIMRGENALDRNRALLDFIDQLAPGDFEGAVASFRALGITESRMGEYSLLLTAWAKVDPVSALTYAKENTGNGFARDTILTGWATQDPEGAIRWAEANFDGEGANPYLAGIIRGIAGMDPARATAVLSGMPRSGERGQGLDYLLPHLLQQGADATRGWIDALQDESLKNGAMVRAARDLANDDPAGTVAWLTANPGDAQQRRMDDVYGVWASKNTSEAIASFAALPAGESRSNALRGIVSAAAVKDPQEAISLLDRYPADVNDRIVQNVVWHAFGSNPATAISAISRISDERQRDQMYRRTVEAWKERDPAAAAAWLLRAPGNLGGVAPR